MTVQKNKNFSVTWRVVLSLVASLAWCVFIFGGLLLLMLITMSESDAFAGPPDQLADYLAYFVALGIFALILALAVYLTAKLREAGSKKTRYEGRLSSSVRKTLIAVGAFLLIGTSCIGLRALYVKDLLEDRRHTETVQRYLAAEYGGEASYKPTEVIYRHDGTDGPKSIAHAQGAYASFGESQVGDCIFAESEESARVFERKDLKAADQTLPRDELLEGYFTYYSHAAGQALQSTEVINGREFNVRHVIDEGHVQYGCPKEDVYYATYADEVKVMIIERKTQAYDASRADFIKFVGSFKNL